MTERRLPKTAVENLVEDLASKANADLSNLDATGQAKFDAKADIALTNSPYTTNRILEIPQDIKLELNNGTLTLKAGSKVYVPNGFEADGTTPHFNVNTTENDASYSGTTNGTYMVFLAGTSLNVSNNNQSGTAIPSGFSGRYYNLTTNRLCNCSNGSVTGYVSFPICIITVSNNIISSINQVFNGFGYIGSTVFALPMKGEATTAINQDGTVTKTIWESTTIQTATVSESGVYSMSSSGVLTAGFNEVGYTKLADVTYYDSRIQNVNFYDVGFVANSNASNFSQSGRSYLSGLGMPSSRYIDLTLGASGSTYTAPANGWVYCAGKTTASPCYISVDIPNTYCGINGFAANQDLTLNQIAVKAGTVFRVRYGNVTLTLLRFVYAQGDQ